MREMLLVSLLCLTFIGGSLTTEVGQRDLTVGPSNNAVVVGLPATMVARSGTTNLLSWYHTLDGGILDPLVDGCAVNPAYQGYYDVDTSPGAGVCNLIILSTQTSDYGLYRTKETTGFAPQLTAHLVVLETDPRCSITLPRPELLDGDIVIISCNVTYSANLSPVLMSWTDPNAQSYPSTDVINPGFTMSTISVTVSPPLLGSFVCVSYFAVPVNATSDATNPPPYTYIYTSPAIDVSHCPSDVEIQVADGSIFVGDTLRCVSDGFPAPSFNWSLAETGETTDGPTMIVSRAGANTFTCTATTTITGVSCSASTTTVVQVTASSCLGLQQQNPNSPSTVYSLTLETGKTIQVYCEMTLGGGGFTFIHPNSLLDLTNAELQSMVTNTSSFLMRTRRTDNNQYYSVLSQLTGNTGLPLFVGLSNYNGYPGFYTTTNFNNHGTPYLYFSFLSNVTAVSAATFGLAVNNIQVTGVKTAPYRNYIALFPAFKSTTYTVVSNTAQAFCNNFWGNQALNPSVRTLPDDFFMFTELGFDAVCYLASYSTGMTTNYLTLSTAIGVR